MFERMPRTSPYHIQTQVKNRNEIISKPSIKGWYTLCCESALVWTSFSKQATAATACWEATPGWFSGLRRSVTLIATRQRHETVVPITVQRLVHG